MKILLVLFIIESLLIVGCGIVEFNPNTVYNRSPLVKQILKPRKGFDAKLTNRVCLEYKEGKCAKDEIATYDLEDKNLRKSLNDLSFVCKIAGKRYKVCLDKVGFCRFTYQGGGWFSKKKKIEEFISGYNDKYLLQANTKCFSSKEYPFSDM